MTNSDLDTLAERLDRAEEAVSLLLAERFGDATLDITELRRQVKTAMPALGREVRARVQARLVDTTPTCQYTGANAASVVEFVDGVATVRADDTSSTVLWLIQNGFSTRVRAGTWLAKDPTTARVYVTESPFAIQEKA